jgi:outer membrane protein, heavy metal efflux system
MRYGLIAVILASCALAGPQPGIAQSPTESLSLEEAIALSFGHNLDLKAFAHELDAQEGRIQQAGARPPPEVHGLVENVLGSGTRSDFDSAEITLSVAMTLERGTRERRFEAASAGSDLLGTEEKIRRLDVAAETARRFIDVLDAQRELEDAREGTALGQSMLASVQKRLAAAQVPRAEVARAEAQLARVELDEEHAEHELAAARRRLSEMWGSTEPPPGSARGDLLAMPAVETFETLRERVAQGSDIERIMSEKRLRESELRLAEARRRPSWQVTAGARRFEDAGDHAFIVGFTIPLATSEYGQGAVAEARARSAQADATAAALRVRLDTRLFGLYQELRHYHAEVATLRDAVVPAMTAAAEQSRVAYERGRYGYGEWLMAQRELLAVRAELREAAANLHRQRIEIERLTGTALGGVPTT